jgi:cytosine/creatinine deaminase
MAFDLIIRDVRVFGRPDGDSLVDIGISGDRIIDIRPGLGDATEIIEAGGRLVSPGLIESHIHLDKSRILDRCSASAREGRDHMERVSAVKPSFTVEDVYDRAKQTLEQCLVHGTMHMRTHVELDPNVGLHGFEALKQLADDYRWAIDLDLCVFAQEGWSTVPEVDANIVAALENGATVIGGAPGYDVDSAWQIDRIFELARKFDVDVDIHLDSGLGTDAMDIHQVCALTEKFGWGGRVAVGHGTKYSSLPPGDFAALARRMADVGVALTVLPATDLFLMGREFDHAVPRGVTDACAMIGHGTNCCLSSNNILNPFTPLGDCSLMRMANLHANVAQRGTDADLAQCFEMLSSRPAALLGREGYALAVGGAADLVVWDATSPSEAVATVAPALFGVKRGRRTFTREIPVLHRP